MDAPTNVRQTSLEHFEASLNSSGGSSGDDNSLSPAHSLLPPGSPSLRPNRRSVEALKKVNKIHNIIILYTLYYS